MSTVHDTLDALGLKRENVGACHGEWVVPRHGKPLVSTNPADGSELGAVVLADDESYKTVVQRAGESFNDWRMVPAPRRAEVVRDLGSELRRLKEPLGRLITLEMGKVLSEGLGEVQEMIDMCEFAVGLSRGLSGPTMMSERTQHRMYEQWHPLGVTAVITSFNFPAAVWSWNAALAAVCGNTVVWKPSSSTPLTAVAVQNICNRVMLRNGVSGVFNLLVGSGQAVGERLIGDSRVPLISFTGSTERGRHVGEVCARRFARRILELGGNNGIIVEPDARMDLALRAIVFAAVGTAGQRCTSLRRLFLHSSIAEEMTGRLIDTYKRVAVGDPLDDRVLMGPLIDEDAVRNYKEAVERAVQEGGEVLVGGKEIDRPGFYVEPTIIRVPSQIPVSCEETFAPIFYLQSYDSLDEVIELHNAVEQGLSSAIFTSNLYTAERFLSHAGSDCGIANVNMGTSGAEIGAAFGGEKATGGGREAGSDAWKAYMRRQSCTINWSTELPLAQGVRFDLT